MFSNGFACNLLDIASKHYRILVKLMEIIELLFFHKYNFEIVLLYYYIILILYYYIIILLYYFAKGVARRDREAGFGSRIMHIIDKHTRSHTSLVFLCSCILYSCIHVLLYYCSIVVLQYCSSVVVQYCIIILLQYCTKGVA